MKKSYCDRCGREIIDIPPQCMQKFPQYTISVFRGYAGDVIAREQNIDLCPDCSHAFDEFLKGKQREE